MGGISWFVGSGMRCLYCLIVLVLCFFMAVYWCGLRFGVGLILVFGGCCLLHCCLLLFECGG